MKATQECSVDDCDHVASKRGLCGMHYQRVRISGGLDLLPPSLAVSDLDRYWAKVDTSGGPDACWLWTAGLFTGSGYGHFWADGHSVRAHRWGYQQRVGPIPAGMIVCHTCDRRTCQNDRHWFLGTNADNTADMFTKGRENPRRGDLGAASRLTEAKVLEIRARYAQGATQQSLADEFGVSRPTISMLVNRKTWDHVE